MFCRKTNCINVHHTTQRGIKATRQKRKKTFYEEMDQICSCSELLQIGSKVKFASEVHARYVI